MSLSKRALAALAALTLLPLAALALLGTGQKTDPARAQALPTQTSANVKAIASLPGTSAIAGVFSRSAPYFYVSGLERVSVLDVSDPRKPKEVGRLENPVFENEAMTLGERRRADGSIQRFLLIGIDLYQASVSGPQRGFNALGQELMVVDVTDPTKPQIIGRTQTSPLRGGATTSTHTVACMNASCSVAYSAGDGYDQKAGDVFSIFDLTDLTKPKQVKEARSPAIAENPSSTTPEGSNLHAGHHWQVDGAGVAWHTGSGGAAAFNISDPMNPVLLNSTDANGRKPGLNDFIQHNSQRPNAKAFVPGRAPNVEDGNVALITEEDYVNNGDEVVCTRAGSFQTWEVPSLDRANPTGEVDAGTIRPLDTIQAPSESGTEQMSPAGAFCSAHWFDYHQSGIVALAHYQQGLRLIDVRDASALKQFGFAAGGATEVWDAYWAPQRSGDGTVTGRDTNLVYTVDAVRGVEVFEVSNLPADLRVTGDEGGRGAFPDSPGAVPGQAGSGARPGAGGRQGGTCGRPVSRFVRGTRLRRGSVRLRGTARGSGCRVTKVRVAIARKTGKLCRFLRRNGRYGSLRSCRRTQYITARGTSRWSLRVPARLRRGKYLAWSRAIDSAGNVERKARPRNFLRLRVGRR